MANYNLSRSPLRMIAQSRTTFRVRAAGKCMRPLALSLLVALMVKFAVRAVYVKPRGSARADYPAGLAVPMPHCNGCRTEREKYGKPPRTLVPLPKTIFDKEFKKKDGWLVC